METKTIDRTQFIGSSDIAAVMNMSRWCSALQLWALKTARLKEEDLSEVEHVQMGIELEDWVAQKFSRMTGLKVRRAPKAYQHRDYDFMRAQVDRLVEGTDELLECKTCSAWKAKEWDGEEIPTEYILQVMWQLGITGRSVGHIAVLIGGQSFKYKRIEFDAELFERMIAAALVFWRMVEEDTPPAAVGMDNYMMVDLFPTNDEVMQQVEELNDRIGLLQQIKGTIAGLEEQKDDLEAAIKQVIGENLGIKTSEYKVTWKGQESQRVDTEKLKAAGLYEQYSKKSKSRVLRVTKEKKDGISPNS